MSDPILISPKTKDVAQRLLAAAEVAGVDVAEVRGARGGFLVSQEVADIFNTPDKPAEKRSAPKAKAKAASKADEPKKEGAE